MRHDVPNPAFASVPEAAPVAPPAATTLVLVVGDDASSRAAMRRVLEQAGHDVAEATTGAAVETVRSRQPHLVLLDAPRADASGRDVGGRLAEDPATAQVLVLRLTAPVAPAVLVAMVQALLRARDAEDALRARDERIATLSHELRSPLSAILMWVSLLRSGRLDAARVEQALDAVERSARLQLQLVDDLLVPARRLGRRAPALPRVPTMLLPALAGIHVLVVDDEPDARDAIAAVLALSGARVTAVSSVADAVAQAATDVPDAVVSDIGMPSEDGFALIARLRQDDATRGVRALALTGHVGADDRRLILEAGFDAYLTKPIDATELVAAVARLTSPPGT